jgi:uncharacterized membrane protein YoaK (UPF0700 family)
LAQPETRRGEMRHGTVVVALALAGGSMDAVSFLGLHRVLTAAMSGNTVLLGISLGQGEWAAAGRSAVALVSYALGVAGGTWLGRPRRASGAARVPLVLAVELVFAAAVGVIGLLEPTGAPSALVVAAIVAAGTAMGLQSTIVRRFGLRDVQTTYVTGMVTTLVGDAAAGDEPGGLLRLRLATWLVYATGAAAGGGLFAAVDLRAAVAPAVAVACALVIQTSAGRRTASS